MTDEEKKEKWREAAVEYLSDKSPDELFDIISLVVKNFDQGSATSQAFDEVQPIFFGTRKETALNVARLLVASEDEDLRQAAYWVVEDWIFRDKDAADIVWSLLGDPSDNVSSFVLDPFEDRFDNAGNDVPLSVIIEAASHLADAKSRRK